MRSAFSEEVGSRCYRPVCAAGEGAWLQAGEEAVHGAGEFGDVGGDGGVDCGEGQGEFGAGGEAGGEGCGEGLEVVLGWLLLFFLVLLLLLLLMLLLLMLGEEDEEVGVDVGA